MLQQLWPEASVGMDCEAGNGSQGERVMESDESNSGARRAAREMLRSEFGISSAFVRVPELAKVLGLAECTIYQAMREGRFFLPHRPLLSSPAVKVEDLVDWYCEGPSSGPGRGGPAFEEAGEAASVQQARASIVRSALARMRS